MLVNALEIEFSSLSLESQPIRSMNGPILEILFLFKKSG
jgi:hypothetical protein